VRSRGAVHLDGRRSAATIGVEGNDQVVNGGVAEDLGLRASTPPFWRLADDSSARTLSSPLRRRPIDRGASPEGGASPKRFRPPVQGLSSTGAYGLPPFRVTPVLMRDAGWPVGRRGLGGATTVDARADPAVGEPRAGSAGRQPLRREAWSRVPRRASVRCSRA
jgi:hypothetical protein